MRHDRATKRSRPGHLRPGHLDDANRWNEFYRSGPQLVLLARQLMSWKMTNEVRQARLAGRLPDVNFTEFAVLLIMADTCRVDSREASLSMSELVKLSGRERSSMSRAVNKLVRLGYLGEPRRGNQHKASSYEVLPGACGADATSTDPAACSTSATSSSGARGANATSAGCQLVALAHEHVALAHSACGASATYPDSPDVFPEGGVQKSSKSPDRPTANSNAPPPQLFSKRPRCARHAHIVNDADVPPCLDCKRLRQEIQTMDKDERARQAAERERRAAEYERIQRCQDCRGGHWVLGRDGTPVDPAMRCTHPTLAQDEP